MDRERAAPGVESRVSKGGDRGQMYDGTKHSSASAATRAGMPLQEIAKLVGDPDLKSTQKYAKLAQGGSLLPLDRNPRARR